MCLIKDIVFIAKCVTKDTVFTKDTHFAMKTISLIRHILL